MCKICLKKDTIINVKWFLIVSLTEIPTSIALIEDI